MRRDPIAAFVPSGARLVESDELAACMDSDRAAKVIRLFDTRSGLAQVLAELEPLLARGDWVPSTDTATTSQLFEVRRFQRRDEPATRLKVVRVNAVDGDPAIERPEWDLELTLSWTPPRC